MKFLVKPLRSDWTIETTKPTRAERKTLLPSFDVALARKAELEAATGKPFAVVAVLR